MTSQSRTTQTKRMTVSWKPRVAVLDFQEDGCEPGAGRAVARRFAIELASSQRLQMIPRNEWLRFSASEELRQQSLFHPGWATHMMTLAGADAIVLGRFTSLENGGRWVRAMMLKASGEIVGSGEGYPLKRVIGMLRADRLTGILPVRVRTSMARLRMVHRSSLLLQVLPGFNLQPTDWLRIGRILESVADPYSQKEGTKWTELNAEIGNVEVIRVAEPFVVVRQAGDMVFSHGEKLMLTKVDG